MPFWGVRRRYMKVNNQFILRTIADEHLLIPVGEAAISVKGLIALSESGALLYEKLKSGCSKEELVLALTSEYEVSEGEALRDIDAFIGQMKQLNMIEED